MLFIFVNPNTFKAYLVKEVQKKTGYQLIIEGHLAWSFYPRLNIVAPHMLLIAPKEVKPFVELYGVHMSAPLQNLFHPKALLAKMNVDKLTFINLHAQNAHITFNLNQQILTLSPITATFYGGLITGTVKRNNQPALPTWQWQVDLKQVELTPLLADLSKGRSKLSFAGKGNIHFQGETQGITREDVINHLNGTSHFTVLDGKLLGIDLNYFLQSADALINKSTLPVEPVVKETPFSTLLGNGIIHQGILSINSIQLQTNTFNATAMGTIRLLSQLIDMHIAIHSEQLLKTQWAIPLILSGDILDPTIRLDKEALAKYIASQEMGKVQNRIEKEIKKDIPKVKAFFENLIGH